MELVYPNYEVIVVDNGSIDDTVKALKQLHPEIKLIEAGRNLGYAGGNNIGIRLAEGEFVFLLNSDVVVKKNTLNELVEAVERDPRIAIAGPLVFADKNYNETWFYPQVFATLSEKTYMMDVKSVVGCALLARKWAITEVGMLDEDYFLYDEEWDWAERMKKAGYRVVCALRSQVFHKIDKNDPYKFLSPIATYYRSRNKFLFARKNFKSPTKQIDFLLSDVFWDYRMRLSWILKKGSIRTLKWYIRGIIDGLSWYVRSQWNKQDVRAIVGQA
jgi:GT2 family glycosyltransferase